jgi:predicted nuclease of predicted toxin-antitoxin system
VKFKLDENLGTSAISAFEDAGHDTSSIHRQGMEGSNDETVFRTCSVELRTLVTLDLDFSNPLTHDPRDTSGVAVLRLSRNPSPTELLAAIQVLLVALEHRPITGELWVVGKDRVRIWRPTEMEPEPDE